MNLERIKELEKEAIKLTSQKQQFTDAVNKLTVRLIQIEGALQELKRDNKNAINNTENDNINKAEK